MPMCFMKLGSIFVMHMCSILLYSNLGFESFTSNAGGLGAKWHSQYPELRKIQPSASSQKIREHKQESNHGDSIAVLKSRYIILCYFNCGSVLIFSNNFVEGLCLASFSRLHAG